MRHFVRIWLTCLFIMGGAALQSADIPDCMLNYRFGPELHLLVVDKSGHSLYVYSNYSPKPVAQFRVTTGKNNGQKQLEGDSKTPEGIYFFTRIISEPDLPKSDDYGEKAFVSDYPNPIDRSENRKGSGIWLHGAHDPEKTVSPNNSRGCVVMKNEDLTHISKYIYLNQTPLCIYDKIRYVSEAEIAARRESFLERLSGWKQSWENRDTSAYIAYYSQDFSSDGMNREAFRRHKDQLNRKYQYIRLFLDRLSLYSFSNYSVAVFNQIYVSDQNHFHNHKIQYWYDEGQNTLCIKAEKSRRLPELDRIEVDKGNWVTINQFRTITTKKILARQERQTPKPDILPRESSFNYPGIQKLTTVNPSATVMNLEITFTERSDQWRYIPVLSVVENDQTRYISLSGIQLRDGVPTNPELGALLTSSSQRFSLSIPADSQARSLTVFLVDVHNRIKQVVTSFFSP